MRDRWAALIGFVFAAAVPPLGLCVLSLFAAHADRAFAMAAGLLPILYAFSVMSTVVFGVPAFLLGRWLRLVRWWSATIVGCAAGLAADVAVRLPRVALGARSEWVPFALLGALAGFVFWLIYSRLRAARD